jgi:conjugal transfer pilus assembly protein TraF
MREIVLIMILSSSLHASGWHSRRTEGWVWHEEKLVEEDIPIECKDQVPSRTNAEKAANIQRELEELKATAVLYPTQENVANFVRFQNQQIDRSAKFASVWQEVILETPDLDYTQQMPVSQYGKKVYNASIESEKRSLIQELSKKYGLFFFYQSSCKYSVAFARVVKEFSKRHNWDVLAISLDGGELDEFPDFKIDNGSADAFGVKAVPALFVVDPDEGSSSVISYGAVALDKIEDNILFQFVTKEDTNE